MIELSILPKLYDADGDLSKDWFVVYYYLNPHNGRRKRFRIIKGLSRIRREVLLTMTEKEKMQLRAERYQTANKLIKEWTRKLKSGYNPFRDPTRLYTDDLSYARRKSEKSIRSYINEALELRCHGRAHGTTKNYRLFADNFMNWLAENQMDGLSINMIDNGAAERFLMSLITRDGNSNKWRNEHMFFMRSIWKQLMKMYPQRIFVNPFAMSEKLKHTRKKTPVFKTDMRAFVKKHLPKEDPQLWLFIQFIYYTGLRPGIELRQLQVKMIDVIEGVIRLPAEITKDRTDRSVTIPKQLLEQLRKMKINKFPRDFYVFTTDGMPGPVMTGHNYYLKKWKQFKANHDLPEEFKIYAFKHTGATAADQAGIDRRAIKEQLGHSSLQMTEQYLDSWSSSISEEIRDNYPTF